MIRGTKRELHKPPTKQFDVNASIHNRFDIEVVDSTSGQVKGKAYAENVICEQLWTHLCSSKAWNTYIHYGTGNGTPSASDISLFSFLGQATSKLVSIDYDYDNHVHKVTKSITLDETVAVDQVLTEVGIAYGSSNNTLVTHAMLKDMNGNPVSLLKTSTDILNIYATVFCHYSCPGGVRVLGAVEYNNTYSQGILSHVMGLISMPSLYVYPGQGYIIRNDKLGEVSVSYNVSERSITVSAPRAGATKWNLGGLKTLFLGGSNYGSEVVFDVEEDSSWFNVTEVRGESVGTGDGTTCDFASTIGFAKNGTVYVDGVGVESTWDGSQEYASILSYFKNVRVPKLGSASSEQINPLYYDPGVSGPYRMGWVSGDINDLAVYENTLYETVGVYSFISNWGNLVKLYASQDMEEWVSFDGVTNKAVVIPEEYRKYRYWKFYIDSRKPDVTLTIVADGDLPSKNNIHLTTPPVEGAVITADYDAICIGKDANHVFDFSVTFQFNEYTEAQ